MCQLLLVLLYSLLLLRLFLYSIFALQPNLAAAPKKVKFIHSLLLYSLFPAAHFAPLHAPSHLLPVPILPLYFPPRPHHRRHHYPHHLLFSASPRSTLFILLRLSIPVMSYPTDTTHPFTRIIYEAFLTTSSPLPLCLSHAHTRTCLLLIKLCCLSLCLVLSCTLHHVPKHLL